MLSRAGQVPRACPAGPTILRGALQQSDHVSFRVELAQRGRGMLASTSHAAMGRSQHASAPRAVAARLPAWNRGTTKFG